MLPDDLNRFDEILQEVDSLGIQTDTLFLNARDDILLARFSSTRRRHPLSSANVSLNEAIEQEKDLLEPISSRASLYLDTSNLNIHSYKKRWLSV